MVKISNKYYKKGGVKYHLVENEEILVKMPNKTHKIVSAMHVDKYLDEKYSLYRIDTNKLDWLHNLKEEDVALN